MEFHFVRKIQKKSKKHQKRTKISKIQNMYKKTQKLNEKQKTQSNLGRMHEITKNIKIAELYTNPFQTKQKHYKSIDLHQTQ